MPPQKFKLFRKINVLISIWQTGIKQAPVCINLMNMRRHPKQSETSPCIKWSARK